MTISAPTYHLPQIADVVSRTSDRNGVLLDYADLTPSALAEAMQKAGKAALALRRQPLGDRLARLTAVVDRWLAPGSIEFERSLSVLPALTGFSPEVVHVGLRRHLEPLAGDAIEQLLAEELSANRNAPLSRSPHTLTHVLSGNIPGLPAASILLSLALGAATLIKTAEGEPTFAAAFARSVNDVDPDLGRLLVVHDWRSHDTRFDDIAFASHTIVAYGSDSAIDAMRGKARHRFIGHGHKISFALATARGLATPGGVADVARRLAFDVALWDQQGCLSPQLCFIERCGRPDDFAAALADALDRVSRELPPKQLTTEERAAIGRFRSEVEWTPASDADRLLTSANATHWSVSLEYAGSFRPTPLNRCIRLVVFDEFDRLHEQLGGHGAYLECAGIAVAPEEESTVTSTLRRHGVHRICLIGEMQSPTLSWRQGGRPRVADWMDPPRAVQRRRDSR